MSEHELSLAPAATRTELMDTLFLIASALKTQVIASPALANSDLSALKNRLSAIADELHGLQRDVTIIPTSWPSPPHVGGSTA